MANLPQITGVSDKQIAYGAACRERKAPVVRGWVDSFEEEAQDFRDAFYSAFIEQNVDAKFWIETGVPFDRHNPILGGSEKLWHEAVDRAMAAVEAANI